MRIAVFGASGGTGRLLVERAAAAGHQVVAVVRDPARLGAVSPDVTVVPADVTDPAAVAAAVRDCDTVVSLLGPGTVRGPTTVRSDATATIVAAMRETEVRRLVVVTAAGHTTDGDGPVVRFLLKPLLSRLLRHSFADMRRTEAIVRGSGLDWTLVRPPRLSDAPGTGRYRTAVDRNVRGGLRLSRADLADFLLRCVDSPAGRVVAIAY
ncbi:SDR family oxidoreductase [Micromonospora yasonensis]|uniref:NAD(P)-dependent oxidoreductase n=1 Tax=Micromonospora yasonensis TaxID=1128667 RepID=UPI00222F5532|nr:SDR family oxidoreductase [Micromonospora yasonensis]MCW3842025.1 SDR family oxidoreductase [Micromonospora yasonensis]